MLRVPLEFYKKKLKSKPTISGKEEDRISDALKNVLIQFDTIFFVTRLSGVHNQSCNKSVDILQQLVTTNQYQDAFARVATAC